MKQPFILTLMSTVTCAATATNKAPENTTPPQSNTPPNILFILCDDMGYGDLGCYGQPFIRTPHIDTMANEGMRFTQAYAGQRAFQSFIHDRATFRPLRGARQQRILEKCTDRVVWAKPRIFDSRTTPL